MNADMDQDMLRMAYQRIQTMPDGPEKQQLLTRLFQDYQGMEGAIGERLNAADENAGAKMPSGVQAGRMFVASTPMHNMSAALRQGFGAYQQGQQQDKLDELAASRTEGLRGVAEMGLQGGGAPVSGTGGIASTGAYAPVAPAMSKDEAISSVLGSEGGYVNDPDDPGGETNKGISKRSYPNEDIPNMTSERARELYERDYWARIDADSLPPESRGLAMDGAVNQGVGYMKGAIERTGGNFDALKADRNARYDSILNRKPEMRKFRKGWKNRLNKFGGVPVAGMIPQPNDEDEMMSTALRAMGSYA